MWKIGKIEMDFPKARTVFAFMFYSSFCYIVLKEMPIPPALNTIISTLMGFYFGQSMPKQKEGGNDGGSNKGT